MQDQQFIEQIKLLFIDFEMALFNCNLYNYNTIAKFGTRGVFIRIKFITKKYRKHHKKKNFIKSLNLYISIYLY